MSEFDFASQPQSESCKLIDYEVYKIQFIKPWN